MKRFFSTVFLSTAFTSLALLSLSSCNKDPESEGKDLAVTLEKGAATENTLTFTVTSANAEKCAYWYGTADQTVPAAEAIIEAGTEVKAGDKTEVTVNDLEPGKEYVIVAAVSGNGKLLASNPLKMMTSGTPFEGVDLVFVEAEYSETNAAGAGDYYVCLATSDPDVNGDPANVGDVVLGLELFNAKDKDPMNAVLPDGDYTPAADLSAFSWSVNASFFYIRTDKSVELRPISGGKVNVKRDGNNYTLLIDIVTLTGENLKARYVGPIQFVQGATAAERFDEPQNVEFEGAQGRYFGNWYNPFSDDMTLEFYAGEVQDGKLVDGYWLNIPAFMSKLDDTSVQSVPVENGTYTLCYGIKSIQYIPKTFKKGEQVNFNGMLLDMGTYLKHFDSKTGRTTIGYVVGGDMKISGSASSYSVEFNFVTEEGVELKGKYSGAINLENKCDNSNREVLESTLKEDHKLNFPDDTKADAHYLGDYLHVGLDSWLLYFMGETEGDTIMLEFFTEKNSAAQLPDGMYTVGDFKTFKANYIIPGFYPYGGGDLPFSWYGDTSSEDSQGYSQKLAPIYGGTMKVSKEGGNHTFEMNFKDDKGHAITGTWSGVMSVTDWTKEPEGAIESFKKQLATKIR